FYRRALFVTFLRRYQRSRKAGGKGLAASAPTTRLVVTAGKLLLRNRFVQQFEQPLLLMQECALTGVLLARGHRNGCTPTGLASSGAGDSAAFRNRVENRQAREAAIARWNSRAPLPSIEDDCSLSLCNAAATFSDNVAALAKELEERTGWRDTLQHLTKHDLYRFIR
ncbi:unnamed protein product, partial [Amoebophrya sp. A120]